MSGNDFVSLLLRTPVRFLMGNTMLVTMTGRKTGRKISTPVNYFPEDGCLWVMTRRDRTWWRNVRQGAGVSVYLNGQTSCAFAEAELDEDTVERRLLDYIRHIPMAAKSLGIRMENRTPNHGDVRRAARDRLFVKIKIDPASSPGQSP